MAAVMTLVRRPRVRDVNKIIAEELEKIYKDELWPEVKKALDAEVSDWVNKPDFYPKIIVRYKNITFEVHVDRRKKSGKIFVWVDQGTGEEGPKHAKYDIVPKKPDGMLVFDVPYHPKTIPPNGLRYDPGATPKVIVTKHVLHPGIRPRRIASRVMTKFKDRSNRKGFFRLTENAYKRAFRRISKMSSGSQG